MINGIYEKNINYLAQVNPSLRNRLLTIKNSSAKLVRGEGGKRTIAVKRGEEIFIHSPKDPKEEAKAFCEDVFKEDSHIVFLFGLGLGYELRELQKKNPRKVYFVVEPDLEVFNCSLMANDIRPIMEEVNLFVGNSEKQIIEALNYIINTHKSIKVKLAVLPAYEIMYKDLWEKVLEGLKKILNEYYVAINTSNSHHKEWVRNYVMNLRYMDNVRPLESLRPYFKDRPAIVVAAGPSLEENLETLKKVGDKALVVGVGSGVSILESYGIKAHMLGSMDGSKLQEKIFMNLKYNKDSMLFYSIQGYYKVPTHVSGRKFLMNQTAMDKYLHKKLGWKYFNKYSAPSISNVITYNLSQLGCNPIIILGQDMCYSKNKSYAKGATYFGEFKEEDLEGNPNYIKTLNNRGEQVYTTGGLLSFKYATEDIIRAHISTTYLNGANQGLKIEGAENIDFNQYYEENLSLNEDIDLPESFNENSEKAELIKKQIYEENQKVIHSCEGIVKAIEQKDKDLISIIKEKEEILSTIPLYNEVLKDLLYFIEYLLPKEYIGNILNKYLYILDKCYIMDKAFSGEELIKE